jgi:hypothetical protein
MALLEDAYKENELDKLFKHNSSNTQNEFKTQFAILTDLPKFERSLWLKPCLIKKFGVKRENIQILGLLIDHAGYCLQDVTTKIYYVVNPYKWDTTTAGYMCYYLLQKDIIKSESDVQEYKSALINKYSLNENNINFLGLTYSNLYCFLDTVTKIYYTVYIGLQSQCNATGSTPNSHIPFCSGTPVALHRADDSMPVQTVDATANYLFGNQDPKNKNTHYHFFKDTESMLFLEN